MTMASRYQGIQNETRHVKELIEGLVDLNILLQQVHKEGWTVCLDVNDDYVHQVLEVRISRESFPDAEAITQ